MTDLCSHISYSLSLVLSKAGQDARRCSRVPGVCRQVGALQYPILLSDQCLQRDSDLYLPDTILARTVLFEHSNGLLAEEDQM